MPRADLNLKYLTQFGARLTELREARGWSREKLAREAGLTRGAIVLYETGHRWPNFAYAIALADALGCTIDALRQPPERLIPKRKRGRPRKAL
jgi:transcriptional regulator with XRE-family HTH domain